MLCPVYIKLGIDASAVQIEEPDTSNGVIFKDVTFSLVAVPPGDLVVTGTDNITPIYNRNEYYTKINHCLTKAFMNSLQPWELTRLEN